MKKIFLALICICLFTWFFLDRMNVFNPARNSDLVNNVSNLEIPNIPQTIQKMDSLESNKISKPLVKNEARQESFEVYDQLESAWLNSVKELLSSKEFDLYLKLRDKNEKEKLQAYQAFHDNLKTKYGQNFKFNISEDHSANEKTINSKYQKQLLKIIGEKKYKEYLLNLDNFNEKNRREHEGQNFIQMEF